MTVFPIKIEMSKKFIIIDAMAMAYRAYFAFINRPLVTSKGEPTSAVYGFISQLIKIFEDHKPDYIAVAFDSHEKTFRHEKYENYKSSRAKMPDDMMPQLDRIKQIVDIMNIPLYIIPGYEAEAEGKTSEDLVKRVLDEVEVNVIDLAHLKINKKAAGRHKDLDDLENLP